MYVCVCVCSRVRVCVCACVCILACQTPATEEVYKREILFSCLSWGQILLSSTLQSHTRTHTFLNFREEKRIPRYNLVGLLIKAHLPLLLDSCSLRRTITKNSYLAYWCNKAPLACVWGMGVRICYERMWIFVCFHSSGAVEQLGFWHFQGRISVK